MKMKNRLYSFLIVITVLVLASCEKNETPSDPLAMFSISSTDLEVNESMEINFTGHADQVVIYTGDVSHNYNLITESNTGFVVNKNYFTYAFATPGKYKVVCVASTYNDLAEDLKRDTTSVMVTVIDDNTNIDNISCNQIVYDEVFANRMNDEWLMVLPRKVKFKNYQVPVSLSQRLKFYTESDSMKLYINDEEYNQTTKYDLSEVLDISVQSYEGTNRSYALYTAYYPEFSSFKINGVSGTIVRDDYVYGSFEVNVVLPAGTDLTNLTPEYTTTAVDEKVYVNSIEQTSGSSVIDFSSEVTYTIQYSLENKPEMVAETKVKINVAAE